MLTIVRSGGRREDIGARITLDDLGWPYEANALYGLYDELAKQHLQLGNPRKARIKVASGATRQRLDPLEQPLHLLLRRVAGTPRADEPLRFEPEPPGDGCGVKVAV